MHADQPTERVRYPTILLVDPTADLAAVARAAADAAGVPLLPADMRTAGAIAFRQPIAVVLVHERLLDRRREALAALARASGARLVSAWDGMTRAELGAMIAGVLHARAA